MIEDPEEVTFDWEFCDFSTISDEKLRSEEFEVGSHKFKVTWLIFSFSFRGSSEIKHIDPYDSFKWNESVSRLLIADKESNVKLSYWKFSCACAIE